MQNQSPTVGIREAVPADLPEITRIERAVATVAHWSNARYGEIFSRTDVASYFTLVAEQRPSASVIGFVVANSIGAEWEVQNLIVDENCRRMGIGSLLVSKLLAKARLSAASKMLLEVRASNGPALGFYRRCGFIVTGRRAKYYAQPEEDAILMTLTFSID